MLRAVIDLLFPPVCGLCDCESSSALCSECAPNPFLSEQLLRQTFCELCGEPGASCIECKVFPIPAEVTLRSLWLYSERVEHLIKGFKYSGRYQLATPLAAFLIAAIRQGVFPPERRHSWSKVVAVPSTNESLAERGYSHVSLLGSEVARELKLDFDPLTVIVRGNHPRQVSLKYEDRLKHLHRKFFSKPCKGERVLLIDDVITSGASVIGAGLALLKSGASSIDILTLARTEHFRTGRYDLSQCL